jgi:heme/copper-type cytochrome/quinol oxidase subunit 2
LGKNNVAGFEENMPDYKKALVPKLIDGQGRGRSVYRPEGLRDANLANYLAVPTPDHVVFRTKAQNPDTSFQIPQVFRIIEIIVSLQNYLLQFRQN